VGCHRGSDGRADRDEIGVRRRGRAVGAQRRPRVACGADEGDVMFAHEVRQQLRDPADGGMDRRHGMRNG